MYLYSTGPVDYFAAFTHVDDFYERTRKEGGSVEAVREYVDQCIRDLEEHTFYEADDLAAGPFVSALPDADYTYPRLIVSVKGSNNGTFYAASPIELPWLREFLTATIDGPSRPNWHAEDEW